MTLEDFVIITGHKPKKELLEKASRIYSTFDSNVQERQLKLLAHKEEDFRFNWCTVENNYPSTRQLILGMCKNMTEELYSSTYKELDTTFSYLGNWRGAIASIFAKTKNSSTGFYGDSTIIRACIPYKKFMVLAHKAVGEEYEKMCSVREKSQNIKWAI